MNSVHGDLEEDDFEYSGAYVRPQAISSMSSLLLQGYIMLAESCDKCAVPLMRHPTNKSIVCVNCGGTGHPTSTSEPTAVQPPVVPKSHFEETNDLTEKETDDTIWNANAPSSSASFDVSQAIADKMLQGWTLMAEHCPRCSTPFIRSKQGKIYCVSCELYAVREQDVDQPAPSENANIMGHEDEAIRSEAAHRNSITKAKSSLVHRLGAIAAQLESTPIGSERSRTLLSEMKSCTDVLQGMEALDLHTLSHDTPKGGV